MKRTAMFVWILVLILGFASQSWCLTYSATDILNHTTPGAIVTSGMAMSTKTTDIGTIGVGTAGDAVPGEIDSALIGFGSGEWIRLDFVVPQIITDIQVAFLYPGPAGGYGDVVPEMAGFITNLGAFTLQAFAPTGAIWTGSGSVINNEVATYPTGGVWEISNPLFGLPVSFIEFRALQLAGGGGADSDYSIVSVSTPSVAPEPTTMLLLGIALIGLVGVRKKFQK